jgi:hypothetical protein
VHISEQQLQRQTFGHVAPEVVVEVVEQLVKCLPDLTLNFPELFLISLPVSPPESKQLSSSLFQTLWVMVNLKV